MTEHVAKRSPATQRMVDQSVVGRALMGGTRAMRDAGTLYLPRFAAEEDRDYRARLAQSWLFNGYRKTVRDMAGRVFAKPVKLGDGAPADILARAENIDLAGNDLSLFARRVFMDAMQSGVSYVWVDAPRREGAVTRADAQRRNLRPYFVHLAVEDILGWKAEAIDNVMRLTQLRMMERVYDEDPKDEFAQVPVDQVRVIDRLDTGLQTRLFRREERADAWRLHEEFASAIPEIPVAPVYLQRTDFMAGEPPLDDLADVNVAHWQSQSDQRNILHFARVPILHATGRDPDDGPLIVAAGSATVSRDTDARLEWVEHQGHAISAGRQDLKDLEFQMETFGLQLLVQHHQQSATGEVLDAKKETSQLAMFADSLKDGLERAFQFMGMYDGGDASIEVEVNDDFGATMMSAQEATVLLGAVNAGHLSRDTFLGELARRGMLAADLDVDEEAERLASAGPADLTGNPLDLNDG